MSVDKLFNVSIEYENQNADYVYGTCMCDGQLIALHSEVLKLFLESTSMEHFKLKCNFVFGTMCEECKSESVDLV